MEKTYSSLPKFIIECIYDDSNYAEHLRKFFFKAEDAEKITLKGRITFEMISPHGATLTVIPYDEYNDIEIT